MINEMKRRDKIIIYRELLLNYNSIDNYRDLIYNNCDDESIKILTLTNYALQDNDLIICDDICIVTNNIVKKSIQNIQHEHDITADIEKQLLMLTNKILPIKELKERINKITISKELITDVISTAACNKELVEEIREVKKLAPMADAKEYFIMAGREYI